MTGRNTLGILGKKLGMSQLFLDDGTCVPVTVVQAGPCPVMQVKMVNAAEHPEGHRQASINNGKKSGKHDRARAADGYYAVQVGFDERAARLCSKAELGDAATALTVSDGRQACVGRRFARLCSEELQRG